MKTAYEIDTSVDGKEWHRLPRRCETFSEMSQVAIAFVDLYLPSASETIAIRFRKVL
jgi:hypothetical protein